MSVFFFSSRRRHTRCSRDWSSDVCSSDLFVVDPELIRQLSEVLLPKSPMHLPLLSSHPQKKALIPLIGLETGSVRMARQIMPSKGVPFSIDDWPSVVLEGLRVANQNNWFPMMTLMVGNPGETDQDVQETLDLVYEMERCGLFAFLIPSIFTPLHDTRMEHQTGVTHTRQLSPLQWQLLMQCWKHNLRPGQYSWWGPIAWRVGSLFMWLYRLRKLKDRKSTRLNSSHGYISYAVFCLKKKKKQSKSLYLLLV